MTTPYGQTQPPVPTQPWAQHQPPQGWPGWLRLHLQGAGLMRPIVGLRVAIDGRDMPSTYGVNDYPLAPGLHRVAVHVPWIVPLGRVEQEIVVHPNAGLEVWYAPPLVNWAPGRMGLVPQQRQGTVGFVLLLALPALLLFGGIIAVIIGVLLA